MNETLTPKELAKILKVETRTLRRWKAQGFGPVCTHLHHGSSKRPTVRYLKDDVLAWLQQNRTHFGTP